MGFDPNDDMTAASLNSALDEVATLVNTVPASGVRPQCFGPQHFDVGVVDPGDWVDSTGRATLTIAGVGLHEYDTKYSAYGGGGFSEIGASPISGNYPKPSRLWFNSPSPVQLDNLNILVLLNVEYWSYDRGNTPEPPNLVTAIQVRVPFGPGNVWRTIARSERWAYPLRVPSGLFWSDTDTPQLDLPTRLLIDQSTVLELSGVSTPTISGIRAVCAALAPVIPDNSTFTLGNCRMSILPFRV